MDNNSNTTHAVLKHRGSAQAIVSRNSHLHKRYHSYDSGCCLPDPDTRCTMSSRNSAEKQRDYRQGSWSSLNYSFSDSPPPSSARATDYSTGSSSKSSISRGNLHTTSSHEVERSDERPLPEISQVPWTESELLTTLRQGNTKTFCDNISVECLHRLSYLLQRPLIRIARECKRLSCHFNKCTQTEMQYACKIILSRSLYAKCDSHARRALVLYSVAPINGNMSKSSQCGLALSVGKHFRWLLEAQTAGYVHELAAVYLTSVMEALAEHTLRDCLTRHDIGQTVITTDMLDAGIQINADYFGPYHYSNQLMSGRNVIDVVVENTLPIEMKQNMNPSIYKILENNLQVTCIGSVDELGTSIQQAMCRWYNNSDTQDEQAELAWSSTALQSLFYYMKCSDLDCCTGTNLSSITLEEDRMNVAGCTPLFEWIRVCCAFAEYRKDSVVDADDVLQAARVLLPNVNCPIRSSLISQSTPNSSAIEEIIAKEKEALAYKLLRLGRTDALEGVNELLGTEGINKVNDQGMTALMYACQNGDDTMVHALLRAGSDIEVQVPSASSKHRTVQQAVVGWTALHFAVANGHISTVKLLLESGAKPDGHRSSSLFCDTPLQLASAMGDSSSTSLLLNKLSDPYLLTSFTPLSPCEKSYSLNAFTLAACHGHREVLRKLFSVPLTQADLSYVSLAEILAEMSGQNKTKTCIDQASTLRNTAEKTDEENIYMIIENDYASVEELKFGGNNLYLKLTTSQVETLKDALYHSAEHGFLDITLEILAMGVPWTIHTWCKTLENAHALQRKSTIQSLLSQFFRLDYTTNTHQLTTCILPLMFDIFRDSKNDMIGSQLAAIFSHLYGPQPVPHLKEIRYQPALSIDPAYINSPQMSDVCFLVENNKFYAHKIVLASASSRFKSIFSSLSDCSDPEIQISDIGYNTFEAVMQYIYTGKALLAGEHKSVRSLYSAANYFHLEGLKRKCEIHLSKSLNDESCLAIYKSAKQYEAAELLEICEVYFLQNLPTLMKTNEQFKRVLYSSKFHNKELLNRLAVALERRLTCKTHQLKRCESTPC